MKITRFETFLANAGLRNYLFLRLTTDTGLQGIGEATLEWQEKTVETLCHEWLADRLVGRDPFDIERIVGDLVRDEYQGGSTVMTAISGAEVALWDLVGKACRQPVYKLLGGRYHARPPAYANGWYGGVTKPAEFAERAARRRRSRLWRDEVRSLRHRVARADRRRIGSGCRMCGASARSGRPCRPTDDRVSRPAVGRLSRWKPFAGWLPIM